MNLNKNNIQVGDIVYNDGYTGVRLEVLWVGDLFATVKDAFNHHSISWDIMIDRLTKVRNDR